MGPAARRSSITSGSFRSATDVRWTYRVHEQILPAHRRDAKVPVRWTDLIIRHAGYVRRRSVRQVCVAKIIDVEIGDS